MYRRKVLKTVGVGLAAVAVGSQAVSAKEGVEPSVAAGQQPEGEQPYHYGGYYRRRFYRGYYRPYYRGYYRGYYRPYYRGYYRGYGYGPYIRFRGDGFRFRYWY
ncbi:hypothetical protein [Haloarchaeobius amylolyticus]|uniref:hypothetical protein n=1 Tax=Haloarchaeobius amylolyticus TaxID=1198296 RepID=UPI00226FBC87|nr:hypothetical protein [Haloarchaeobius amylolyticus]